MEVVREGSPMALEPMEEDDVLLEVPAAVETGDRTDCSICD
jgi:hypothetical protein